MSTDKGVIYGLGLGPGDPDLISVKADRILRKAAILPFSAKGAQGACALLLILCFLRKL